MSFEQWLYAWRVRLRELFCRDRVDRELDDELRHHVALETEARRAQGAPPHEARRQALATLGGFEATRNHVRDARFGAALEHVLQDVRYVLRVLRRNPGFTATTVLTLTLAISATTATFSVVDAVLLQPPPFPEPGASRHVVGDGPRERQPARRGRLRELPRLARAGDELRARRRPRPVVGRPHRRRHARGALRVAGHGRVLRGARYRCRPRAHVPARRAPAGQRRGRHDGRALAAPLRRRPRRRRPDAGAGRRAAHGGGGPRADLRAPPRGRSKRPRHLPPQGHRRVRALHSKRRLVAGDRPDPPRRHPGRGPVRDGRRRGPARS